MKRERHAKILEIVSQNTVETQEQLIDHLKAAGYNITQATVSRDIKDLKLVKTTDKNGFYKYAVSAEKSERPAAKYHNIVRETVVSIDHAENMVVIKTYPGMAGSAAAAIDSLHHEGVVGSIAGDDTIMIVMRNSTAASTFSAELYSYFSE